MTSKSLLGYLAKKRLKKVTPEPITVLRDLLFKARHTRFGTIHNFESLLAQPDIYQAFHDQIPISDYSTWIQFLGQDYHFEKDQPSPLVNQAWPGTIKHFCLSSGTTTGKTKYIPYSREMAVQNRRAAIDLLANLILLDPGLKPHTHKTLYMSGSTHLKPDRQGVVSGDMSGLTRYLAPPFISWLAYPPHSISSLEPWNARLPELVRFSIRKRKHIGILSGIPVWQLSFLNHVKELTGDAPHYVFPNLKFFIHGGMPLGPYEKPLKELLGPQVRFINVYAASETGISATGFDQQRGMELYSQYGVFYELQTQNGENFPSWEAKPHVDYSLIVTSCSGLWRYKIGDSIRFSQTKPLMIDTVFRSQTTTAFDEKVSEEQVIKAMTAVFPEFPDFSMGPDLERNRHQWFFILPADTPDNESLFHRFQSLDETLRSLNQDYDDYRQDGRIQPPALSIIRNRSDFLAKINRSEGGQRKFPRFLSEKEVQKSIQSQSKDISP